MTAVAEARLPSSAVMTQQDTCSQFCWLLNKAVHAVEMLCIKLVHDIDN